MDNSQLLKGILEGCVLAIIAEGETYGYEIIGELEKAGFEVVSVCGDLSFEPPREDEQRVIYAAIKKE